MLINGSCSTRIFRMPRRSFWMKERIGVYYDSACKKIYSSHFLHIFKTQSCLKEIHSYIPKPILSISLSNLLKGSFIILFLKCSSKHRSNHVIENTTVLEVCQVNFRIKSRNHFEFLAVVSAHSDLFSGLTFRGDR